MEGARGHGFPELVGNLVGNSPGGETPRACGWCRQLLEQTARRDQLFCSQRCRQWAFRLRRRRTTAERAAEPMRFAYADPPYPGLARRYYGDQPTYAGEVDHAALIASLAGGGYAGWALSTSEKALRDVLPMCPPEARVAPWVKPIGAAPATFGAHNTWEPLIVVPGRRLRPGFRDWLCAQPARGGGELPGRKPVAFCAFLFQQLGMLPGDELVDLFPGTGVVGRAWAEMCRAAPEDTSLRTSQTSPRAAPDASSHPGGDEPSARARSDAFPRGESDVSPEYSGDGKLSA